MCLCYVWCERHLYMRVTLSVEHSIVDTSTYTYNTHVHSVYRIWKKWMNDFVKLPVRGYKCHVLFLLSCIKNILNRHNSQFGNEFVFFWNDFHVFFVFFGFRPFISFLQPRQRKNGINIVSLITQSCYCKTPHWNKRVNNKNIFKHWLSPKHRFFFYLTHSTNQELFLVFTRHDYPHISAVFLLFVNNRKIMNKMRT